MSQKKKFICSRQIECLIEVEAYSLRDALSQLPDEPDALLEVADGVAFGSQWSVQMEGTRSRPQLFDDSDIEEAKKPSDELLLGE